MNMQQNIQKDANAALLALKVAAHIEHRTTAAGRVICDVIGTARRSILLDRDTAPFHRAVSPLLGMYFPAIAWYDEEWREHAEELRAVSAQYEPGTIVHYTLKAIEAFAVALASDSSDEIKAATRDAIHNTLCAVATRPQHGETPGQTYATVAKNLNRLVPLSGARIDA